MSKANPRETKQRHAIRRAFEVADRPFGPKEVLDIAGQEVHNLGIATVYRNIKTMVDQGALETINLPGEPPRYDLPRPKAENSSLIMCKKTNRVFHGNQDVHIELPTIPGFNIKNYQIIFYGESDANSSEKQLDTVAHKS
jgi:Fur family transcriptional regulator, ferric uptake regulator